MNIRLNGVRVRQMIDPVYKNVLRKQNPFEIVFKDISKFDAQNSIIKSLLSEIESGKLTDESVKKFLNKAPNLTDIELNQKLKNLKSFNGRLQLNDDNDNDSDDDNDSDNDGRLLPRPVQLQPPPI